MREWHSVAMCKGHCIVQTAVLAAVPDQRRGIDNDSRRGVNLCRFQRQGNAISRSRVHSQYPSSDSFWVCCRCLSAIDTIPPGCSQATSPSLRRRRSSTSSTPCLGTRRRSWPPMSSAPGSGCTTKNSRRAAVSSRHPPAYNSQIMQPSWKLLISDLNP